MRQNATLCVFFMVVLSPTTKGPSSIKQNITTYSHEVLALFVHSLAALKREIRIFFKWKFCVYEIKLTPLKLTAVLWLWRHNSPILDEFQAESENVLVVPWAQSIEWDVQVGLCVDFRPSSGSIPLATWRKPLLTDFDIHNILESCGVSFLFAICLTHKNLRGRPKWPNKKKKQFLKCSDTYFVRRFRSFNWRDYYIPYLCLLYRDISLL